MPNPTTVALALAQEATDRFDAELRANRLGCALLAAECGPDAELVAARALPTDPICEACQQGWHDDPLSSGCACACACHALHRQRGSAGGAA